METTQPGELPGGRWLFTSVFVHAVAEFSAWIAVLVVAFDRGGPSAAGLAVTAQLVPAALLAPVVGAAGDRFPRQRVLAVSFFVQGASTAGIAAALLVDSPLVVVYVFAALFTVATIATPATIASLLVHHARTPTQLTRWNIIRSFTRAAGSLVGPLLTALLLAFASPTIVFVGLAAACIGMGILAGWRLPDDDRLHSTLSVSAVLGDSWRGISYVATAPAPRTIVAYIGAAELLLGALDLVFVAVAFDQLDRGGSTVALIAMSFASGTLLAVSTASRRSSWQLSQLVLVGAALLTVPLLIVSQATVLPLVLVLAGLLGAGNGLVEIGSQTLLQRSCTETMTSRAYGALDSTTLIAASVGAAIAGHFIVDGGLTSVLIVLSVGGAIVLIGGSLRLRATERSLQPTDARLVSCLRAVTFLTSLPQPTLDRLARVSQRRHIGAGTHVVIEGEPGDEFFVLVAGEVEVTIGDQIVDHLCAPASFGEVALLHDSARSATVTTTGPCEFAVIRQDDFVDAIRRTASSHRAALDAAQQYRPAPEQG
jgi:MFS family permease